MVADFAPPRCSYSKMVHKMGLILTGMLILLFGGPGLPHYPQRDAFRLISLYRLSLNHTLALVVRAIGCLDSRWGLALRLATCLPYITKETIAKFAIKR